MRKRWFRTKLAALSFTLLLGCVWQGHVKKGDEFMAAANYDAAAAEYTEALRLRPDDQEIASKLAEAQAGQVELRAQQARAALEANETARAITIAAETHAILPLHPTTVALIDEVVDVASQRAGASAQAGQFAEAMAIYDTIAARLPSASERVSADAKAVTDAWVAHLSTAASEAETAGRSGSALLYRSKIAALSGQATAEHDAIREQVVAQLRYLVVVKSKGGEASTVASMLIGRQPGTLLEVASEGNKPAATLTLTVGKPKFANSTNKRQEQVQYQSGTKQVENPHYKMAQDKVLDEERRLVERENEVTKQEQYVAQYRAEVAKEGDTPNVTTGMEQNLYNAENRLEAAQRAVADQRNAVIRAKERAASTSQFTEEPVYSTHAYAITTHVLTATVQVKAQLVHADGRPTLAIDQPLSVAAQDDEHGAQSVAGIPEDPLILPSKDQLAGQLLAQAGPIVGAVIGESFAVHRQALREQANAATDPNQKLELLIRYVVLDPRNVDPQATAEILTLSGVPDAPTLLAGP